MQKDIVDIIFSFLILPVSIPHYTIPHNNSIHHLHHEWRGCTVQALSSRHHDVVGNRHIWTCVSIQQLSYSRGKRRESSGMLVDDMVLSISKPILDNTSRNLIVSTPFIVLNALVLTPSIRWYRSSLYDWLMLVCLTRKWLRVGSTQNGRKCSKHHQKPLGSSYIVFMGFWCIENALSEGEFQCLFSTSQNGHSVVVVSSSLSSPPSHSISRLSLDTCKTSWISCWS